MEQSQKNFVPKKLTISEMWQLYRLLKDGVSNPLGKDLFDNVKHIFSKVNPQYIRKSIKIMYGDDVHWETSNEVLLLFSAGLIGCKFFEFHNFIGKL